MAYPWLHHDTELGVFETGSSPDSRLRFATDPTQPYAGLISVCKFYSCGFECPSERCYG
jgi:hypothetical protein